MSKDYEGTLEKAVQVSFNAIEIGGFGPYTTEEWKSVLNRLNLRIVSNHIQIEKVKMI